MQISRILWKLRAPVTLWSLYVPLISQICSQINESKYLAYAKTNVVNVRCTDFVSKHNTHMVEYNRSHRPSYTEHTIGQTSQIECIRYLLWMMYTEPVRIHWPIKNYFTIISPLYAGLNKLHWLSYLLATWKSESIIIWYDFNNMIMVMVYKFTKICYQIKVYECY